MKKPSAFVLSLSFLFCVCVLSCDTSVDEMLEEYNKGFNQGYVNVSNKDESEYSLEPDDSGYDQNRLLFDEYTVFDIGTLNLAAPISCRNFKWVLTDPAAEDTLAPLTVRFYDGQVSDSRATKDYVVYMPESKLESEHTYKLTLTVTGKAGGVYTDSCLIFVVKYYINY